MIQGQEAFELLQGRVLELERKVRDLRALLTPSATPAQASAPAPAPETSDDVAGEDRFGWTSGQLSASSSQIKAEMANLVVLAEQSDREAGLTFEFLKSSIFMLEQCKREAGAPSFEAPKPWIRSAAALNGATRRTLRTARELQSILRLQGEMKSALETRIKDLLALVDELRRDRVTADEKLREASNSLKLTSAWTSSTNRVLPDMAILADVVRSVHRGCRQPECKPCAALLAFERYLGQK